MKNKSLFFSYKKSFKIYETQEGNNTYYIDVSTPEENLEIGVVYVILIITVKYVYLIYALFSIHLTELIFKKYLFAIFILFKNYI